jgi:acetyltransferase
MKKAEGKMSIAENYYYNKDMTTTRFNFFRPGPGRSLYMTQDGTTCGIRTLRAEDAPRLVDFLTKLSRNTLWLRFLSPIPTISLEKARQEVSTLWLNNPYLMTAYVVTIRKQKQEQIIGTAEIVSTTRQYENSEFAILIRDDYQGKGIGTALMKKLVMEARTRKVSTLQAYISTENLAMFRLIKKLGLPITTQRSQGTMALKVHLS